MRHATPALIARAQNESSHDLPPAVVLLERKLHPKLVRAPASKAAVRGIRLQPDGLVRFAQIPHNSWPPVIFTSLLRYILASLNPYLALRFQTKATRLRSARRTPRCRFRISIFSK